MFLQSSTMMTVLRLISRLLPLYKPPEMYAIDYLDCCQYPIMTSLQITDESQEIYLFISKHFFKENGKKNGQEMERI